MEREVSTLSSSSDEDEDEERQTLITQNPFHINNNNNNINYSPKPHLSSSSSSIFQIDNNNNNNHVINNNSPKLTISKKYLFFIFLFIFILILFLTTSHFSSPSSHSDSTKPVSPFSNRILESQLHALYLLKNQQFSLFKLWNHTHLNLTYPDLAFFNSELLSQISLNKQIQHLILSAHQTRGIKNNNSGLYDFNYINSTDFELFSNTDACGKVDQKLAERKTVDWKPDSGKYLFAICVSGQMSNHLICLEKHMFFAALLNRVLVIPSAKIDYQFDRVLDIEHINKCLGRKVVVTFDEFAEAKKSNLHIDRFICYFSKPQACFLDDDHVKKIKSLGLTVGSKLEPAWVEDVKSPSKRTMQDVVSKFGSKDDVIAIGDVFFADVEREMVMQPGGPIAHKCKTLIEPSRLIMLTAQRFVQTFLGERFIALHFRRHGFLKFCNAKSPSCFFPIPQAAECISRLVEKANTPVIYLSTDAAESETNLLQSLIVLNGQTVPLVKRPARNSAEKWDALLYRHGIEGDPQVEAMLDKTISAMSSVFIGASGSTFTEDILRLRKDWGSASLCDEYLCQGEVPNFIADNE